MPTLRFLPWMTALIVTACSQAATLSDNLNASTFFTELVEGSTSITAGFRTDASSYTLSGVTALMQQDTVGTVTLDLYSSVTQNPANDLGFQPGTLLGTLTSPSSYPAALGQVTFSGNLLLAPSTTYWLVMSASTGTFEWAYADDQNGSGPGFYPSWGVTTDSGASWYTSDLQPMQMRVMADPIGTPEPSAWALVLVGLAAFGVRAHRSARH